MRCTSSVHFPLTDLFGDSKLNRYTTELVDCSSLATLMPQTRPTHESATRLSGLELAEEMRSRRPVSAWMMSVLMHASLVLLLGVSWRMIPKGAAIEPDRNVGIVLVHEQQGKREYIDPSADNSANDLSAASAISQALPGESETPTDLSQALPGVSQLTAGGMAESILEATQLTGDGSQRRGGKEEGTSTEVFGITGSGSKFVYVFDRSGSMANYAGKPLRAAKLELTRSLEDLDTVHQFQIIFYNNNPKIFKPTGRAEMIWGDTENKLLGREFVAKIEASGGTEHLPALRSALAMSPDVVFFLTDADQPTLSAAELAQVRRWNRGATIHAIEFGAGPQITNDNFLMRLARENGGQHAYVNVRLLRDNP